MYTIKIYSGDGEWWACGHPIIDNPYRDKYLLHDGRWMNQHLCDENGPFLKESFFNSFRWIVQVLKKTLDGKLIKNGSFYIFVTREKL